MMFNLNGTQLKITTRYDNVYNYDVEIQSLNNSKEEFRLVQGFSVFIFRELSSYLNFSYKLCPEIGTFGTSQFNESTINKIDMIVGAYGLFEARAKILSPTFSTGSSKIVAIINHDFETTSGSIVFQPFEYKLWLTLLAFLVTICLAIATFPFGVIEDHTHWKDRVFLVMASFFQKSTNIGFQSFKCRLIIWMISITGTTLLACYSGTLVSLFAIKFFEIDTLDTLLNSSFKILLERGYNNSSPIQAIAETLKDLPSMNKLLDKARASKFVHESFEKTIELVQSTRSAHIIDKETASVALQNQVGHFPCSLGAISVAGISYPWSLYMKKNSPFKPAINFGLVKLDQSGIIYRARKRWIPKFTSSSCQKAFSTSQNKVTLEHVLMGFIIYAAGLFLSFAVLLVFEIFVFRNSRKSLLITFLQS